MYKFLKINYKDNKKLERLKIQLINVWPTYNQINL
jgi:hypothetical protein